MSKQQKIENNDLDIWIEQLKNCYILEESIVKILCEKSNILILLLNIGKRNFKSRAKCFTNQTPNNNMW